MVVRERRRISSLARTASSLDEKLQQAEKAVEGSEAYLRSYMDEHRHLAAELTHSQQKSILSLMEMVKADGAKNAGKDGRDAELSQFDDRKLLVLANERIAALENHIQNLETEADQKSDYREEIKNLREAYDESCKSISDLDAERWQTLDALREVREHLTRVGNDSGDGSSHVKSAIRLVKRLLNDLKKGKVHRGAQNDLAEESKISVGSFDDDRDSVISEDEMYDDPDFAAEIMEDLAFIAEGKIPPSMQNLPGFTEQVAEMESVSVFDRLTNPDNFTGTQKRKVKKARKVQISTTQRSRAERSASSLPDQVHKTRIPETEAVSDHSITPTNACSGEASMEPITTTKKEYKSVFERLVSPSQATGTQRQKLARKNQLDDPSEHGSESGTQGDDFDKMLDDVLGEASEISDSQSNDGKYKSVFERLVSPSQATGTQKHRLAEKSDGQSGVAVSRSLSDNFTESPSTKEKRIHARNYSDYAEQDVFERLQKTSTVSYQNRQGDMNWVVHHSSFSDGVSFDQSEVQTRSSNSSVQDESQSHHNQDDTHTAYTRLNVFERLTRTTTEAYAQKVHRPRHTEDDNHT